MNSTAQNGDTDQSIPKNGEHNLEQIREILFGHQSRDIDTRFQAISDQIAESMGGLRSLIHERTDAVSQRLDRELQALQRQVAELTQRDEEQHAALEHKLKSSENELRQQLGGLAETLSSTERAIRNEAEQGLRELREHLTAHMESIRDHLHRDLHNVSSTSVSKRSFRDALLDLSSRFDDDD